MSINNLLHAAAEAAANASSAAAAQAMGLPREMAPKSADFVAAAGAVAAAANGINPFGPYITRKRSQPAQPQPQPQPPQPQQAAAKVVPEEPEPYCERNLLRRSGELSKLILANLKTVHGTDSGHPDTIIHRKMQIIDAAVERAKQQLYEETGYPLLIGNGDDDNQNLNNNIVLNLQNFIKDAEKYVSHTALFWQMLLLILQSIAGDNISKSVLEKLLTGAGQRIIAKAYDRRIEFNNFVKEQEAAAAANEQEGAIVAIGRVDRDRDDDSDSNSDDDERRVVRRYNPNSITQGDQRKTNSSKIDEQVLRGFTHALPHLVDETGAPIGRPETFLRPLMVYPVGGQGRPTTEVRIVIDSATYAELLIVLRKWNQWEQYVVANTRKRTNRKEGQSEYVVPHIGERSLRKLMCPCHMMGAGQRDTANPLIRGMQFSLATLLKWKKDHPSLFPDVPESALKSLSSFVLFMFCPPKRVPELDFRPFVTLDEAAAIDEDNMDSAQAKRAKLGSMQVNVAPAASRPILPRTVLQRRTASASNVSSGECSMLDQSCCLRCHWDEQRNAMENERQRKEW